MKSAFENQHTNYALCIVGIAVLEKLKSTIKRHRRLLRISRMLLRRNSKISYLSEASQFAFAADWARKLPYFDVYVGIPRKGLVIAAVIATLKGKPLSTPDNFVRGKVWHHSNLNDIHSVLLVEDSSNQARQTKLAKEMICKRYPDLIVKTASLIVCNKAMTRFYDFYYVRIASGVMLEGSLLSTGDGLFGNLATDMDGVLCEDLPKNILSETSEYVEWMKTVKPLLIPNFTVQAIITSRLDVHRETTERWLKANGVRYKKLFMRWTEQENPATFKSRIINHIKPNWFWESSYYESRIIARSAKVQVFCVEQNQMVQS